MGDEALQTVKEVAKATHKGLEVSEKLGQFFSMVLGETIKEAGKIGLDEVRAFRYSNLLRLSDKVDAKLKKRKLEGKTTPIPKRFAVPMIENASLESEDSIQERWAGLIASAMDPERHLSMRKVYIQILSSFEPLDVLVLEFLTRQGWRLIRNISGGGIDALVLEKELGFSVEDIKLSLGNLVRLGCVTKEDFQPVDEKGYFLGESQTINKNPIYIPTTLGVTFVKACQKKENADP